MAAAVGFSSSIYESDRENVMKHLLDAVKQCQVHFGGKTDLATEKDSCVQCLLSQFENAFLHGLKRGKVWGAISSLSEPLRHVTGKVLSGIPDAEITFWPFIKEHMSPSEIHRYLSFGSISTDSGRCRSWLRSCLNETSLERNLIAILADKNVIRQFYEDWALFVDEERASTLPMMARGLGSILFAIEADSAQLNSPFKQPPLPKVNLALAPVGNKNKNDPLSAIPDKVAATDRSDPSIVNKKKRKKKVKQATIEDVEVPEDEPLSGMYLKEDAKSTAQRREPSENTLPKARDRLYDIGKAVSLSSRTPDGEIDSAKSHRRATSLESSEIIRQKQDRYGAPVNFSTEFEVPAFGNVRQGNAKTDGKSEASRVKHIPAKRNEKDSDVFEMDEEVESKENPEYTSILSKLANLSTSFKTSFTTGIFQREQGVKESAGVERPSTDEADQQDDLKSLLDDESDVFNRTSKLEMGDHNDSLTNQALQVITHDGDEVTLIGNDTASRRRSSEDFDRVLVKGEALSPRDNSFEKLESVLKLKTPPPTPADGAEDGEDNGASHRADMSLQSAGLESKLDQLEKEALAEYEPDLRSHLAKTEDVLVSERIGYSNMLNDGTEYLSKPEDADRISINSSTTSSVIDDSDTLQPVGFESERFSNLVLSYDKQSSQAASDTLQLLKTSAEVSFSQDDIKNQGRANNQDEYLSRPYNSELRQAGSSHGGDLSKEELKQAILATVKRKDELDETNRVLQLALDEERELCLSLKSDVDNLSEKLLDVQETSNKKVVELSRENEVLRNQLKKYVAAVQLLKRENKNVSKETSDAISTLRGYSDESEVILPQQPKERTDSEMDNIFEEKLIQLAQLHGELMEFQEVLQRDLVRKEKAIGKMREELVILRGPLPDDLDPNQDDERGMHARRPLINVWIPSVFIKGKGSDAHHIYQIYIRIGDEEWNIYRRYSQFHKMHLTCTKVFQDVEKLNFPPKKLIGKKDLKFVEGRRKKLQNYIRKLINVSLANNMALNESPNKENLEKSLPFFSDEFFNNGKKKREVDKKKSARPAVYTGL